jgi:hypothetical protein
MRFAKTCAVVLLFGLPWVTLFAKQAANSEPQPLLLLQQSLGALVGKVSVSDITLTGAARRIAGSDDESGTVVLKGIATGIARVDLDLQSGSRSEFSNVSTAHPAGAWAGSDGVGHPISGHNLLFEPSWFFPTFGIIHELSSSNYVLTYIGQEIRNSESVYHITVHQMAPNALGEMRFFEHLTEAHLYLDTATLLPAALTFNSHPDNNAAIDIPVEITYADYRSVDGLQVPFRVQRYFNGSLFLDLQLSTARSNSGLSANALEIR